MISIDKRNGNVVIPGFIINKATKINLLPKQFTIGNEFETIFVNKRIKCLFASFKCEEGNLNLELSLRFEFGNLVRVFISLEDKHRKYKDMEFYESGNERILLHSNWLLKQGIPNSGIGMNYFNWGKLGIARDKSENVFIYINFT